MHSVSNVPMRFIYSYGRSNFKSLLINLNRIETDHNIVHYLKAFSHPVNIQVFFIIFKNLCNFLLAAVNRQEAVCHKTAAKPPQQTIFTYISVHPNLLIDN